MTDLSHIKLARTVHLNGDNLVVIDDQVLPFHTEYRECSGEDEYFQRKVLIPADRLSNGMEVRYIPVLVESPLAR